MTTPIIWTKLNNNEQTAEIEGRTFIAKKRIITTGKGNKPIVRWFIYRNDAQRPYVDAYVNEGDLRAAKREFAKLVEAQLGSKPAPVPTSEPEPAPMVDQPAPITYPIDITVTTAQRNYVLNHMVFMDANYPASHVIRIFSAKEHARFNQCLEELESNPPAPKGKIGDSNTIPANTTDKWQVWQFLFGYRLHGEYDTEAEAQAACDEIYNARVVAPEPIEFLYAEKYFNSVDESRRADGKPIYGETYEVTFDSNSIPDYRPTLVLIFLTETKKGYFCKRPDAIKRLFIKHSQNPTFNEIGTK